MIMMDTYQQSGPDFRLCGEFTGQEDQTASCWLKKFELEMTGYISESQATVLSAHYFRMLNALLAEEAVM